METSGVGSLCISGPGCLRACGVAEVLASRLLHFQILMPKTHRVVRSHPFLVDTVLPPIWAWVKALVDRSQRYRETSFSAWDNPTKWIVTGIKAEKPRKDNKLVPCYRTNPLYKTLSCLALGVYLTQPRVIREERPQVRDCLSQTGPWACLWGMVWVSN